LKPHSRALARREILHIEDDVQDDKEIQDSGRDTVQCSANKITDSGGVSDPRSARLAPFARHGEHKEGK